MLVKLDGNMDGNMFNFLLIWHYACWWPSTGNCWGICGNSAQWSLQWRHNKCDGVSNHQCLDCLLNYLFKRKSKKTSKLRVAGPCEGNPSVTGGFPLQKVTRTMIPFDNVIMFQGLLIQFSSLCNPAQSQCLFFNEYFHHFRLKG